MTVAILSTKGQLTIPVYIRRQFHLKPKDKVDIHIEKKEIVLCPIPDDPVEACFGALKTRKSTAAIMHAVRKEEKQTEAKKWKM
jgi:AbrB family looped-hinge helix DNA binding protein